MSSSWIPGWASLAWLLIYAVIAAWHVGHLAAAGRSLRVWHTAHVLVAVGMIDMFWPGGAMPVGPTSGQAVFGAAAAAVVAAIAVAAARGRPVGRLWVLTAADLAVMAYMFALSSVRYLVVLTTVLAAWQVAEAIAWASGYLCPAVPGTRLVAAGGARGLAVPRPASSGHEGLALRASLALMSLGMAYMLVAMQFGMPMPGPAGPLMPGMPGM